MLVTLGTIGATVAFVLVVIVFAIVNGLLD